MFKRLRYGAAAFMILSPALLFGCAPKAAPSSVASNTAAPAPVLLPVLPKPAKPIRVFTLNTPVDHIAADPNGKAILDRDVPGLMASKDYPLFDDMSLSEIATVSGGRLTKTKLDQVQADLIQISYLSP